MIKDVIEEIRKNKEDITRWLVVIVVVIGIAWVLSMMFSVISNSIPVSNTDVQIETNTSIVSISDGKLGHGSFFLGSGTFSEKMYFVYYENTTTGYRLKKVSADDTSIMMDEDTSPYLTTFTYDSCSIYKDGSSSCYHRWYPVTYVFHVPNGTIVQNNFKLDGNL